MAATRYLAQKKRPVLLCALRHWKAIQTALLLALLGFQAAGWLVTWQLALVDARQSARETIRQQPAHLIERTLSIRIFKRCLVDENELRLEGQMFDIASLRIESDSVRLRLYRDVREERLHRELGQLLMPVVMGDANQSHPAPPTLYTLLAKWLHAGAMPPEMPRLPGFVCVENRVVFHLPGIPLSQVNMPQHGPPPKV
ncbi:MAG: hypothetical protein ACKVU2_07965 [Saprospiraceae bacterium]